MTKAEIEAALLAAFSQCEAINCPLTDSQKQILLQIADQLAYQLSQEVTSSLAESEAEVGNPLDEMTDTERQLLLQFVTENQAAGLDWKTKLLDDWLHGIDSGNVQFIREQYGPQWLERVQPNHLIEYADDDLIDLKVGDRIEVSNSLWEWVQESGPCQREWIRCTVVALQETPDTSATARAAGYRAYTNCTIRFDNGMEYQIQGIYQWNRYNWRWPSS